jgi:hypothetical protein
MKKVAGFLSFLLGLVKMGPIRCPETSVNNYHTTSRNIPEERRSEVLRYFTFQAQKCFISLRTLKVNISYTFSHSLLPRSSVHTFIVVRHRQYFQIVASFTCSTSVFCSKLIWLVIHTCLHNKKLQFYHTQ